MMPNNFDPMTFNMMLNMMNVMHPNMGYNQNNFNMNNNNQNLMNMMMNWMNMNPILYQMYQNMMNQNNNNMNQFNNNNNYNFNDNDNRMNILTDSQSSINQAKVTGGGILPKNIQGGNYDVSPYDNSLKTNICFTTQKGQKMNIICPYNMKVRDLFIKYVQRLGLGPNVLGDSIFFLFNGSKINKNDNRSLGDLGLVAGSNIIVLDLKGVIGS